MEIESELIVKDVHDSQRDLLGLALIAGESGLTRPIREAEVQRPGLALAGFLDYFSSLSIQLVGRTELAFMETLDAPLRIARWRAYLECRPAALIVCRTLQLEPEVLEIASSAGVAVFTTNLKTGEIVHRLELWLERELAPATMSHGVLLDVFGVGVLILGDSGVGKSETALEMIKRGQRLVSDDIVEIRKMRRDVLVGTSPALTKHHIEIRGLGILNIRQLYGAAAVVDEMEIDMVVRLERWKEGVEYDRLGLEQDKTEILGIDLPSVLVPVQPGRNIAVIVEVGAMNQRLKNMGVHAAEEFSRRLNEMLATGAGGRLG
jgi:HPr kinase/phosphorylase